MVQSRRPVGTDASLSMAPLVSEWIRAHCVIPDGFRKGQEFNLYDYQLRYLKAFYEVKPDAVWDPSEPLLGPAFRYRRAMLAAPQKALALDTPIATPSGWTTMGDVQPGDFVFDERGEPTRVLSKSQVWDVPTYRVTFSDHSSLVACGDHEWWVEERTNFPKYVERRIRTEDMVGRLLIKGARRLRVPMAKPLQTEDIDLPIPPYTLGAWLGDGETDGARITGLDKGVFERIEMDGFEVRPTPITKRVGVIGLRKRLRLTGVLGNKHIPAVYLRASEKQRWALLQGLMDTDGYCPVKGGCEYTTVLPVLRDGIVELLLSLGLKPVAREGLARLNGRVAGPKYRIGFAARSDSPIFGLERKQSRLKAPGGSHAQFEHRRIVSVEPCERVLTQCLTVEAASHVFLAGREMIPTCNTGKGPMTAAHVCVEGVGPALFAGWADKGDAWVCAEHGCGCGWTWEYDPGEPMGMCWPTPLAQLAAVSEAQVGNIFDALRPMIQEGPLADIIPKTGEEFIRLPNGGRIDVVTSSATSRLGQRVTFVAMDEVGLWTAQNRMTRVADTMFRGLAGMGGRASLTTNAWDPTEQSVAQRDYESSAKDIYRQYLQPPANLSYRNKVERRKIHRIVYEDALKERNGHVDLDSIEAEAADLLERDPAQASRFFGNILTHGQGKWLQQGVWESAARPAELPPPGTRVCAGFDGSETSDHSGIRLETIDGWSFMPTYGPDGRRAHWNPAEWGGRIPRGEVHAAVDAIFDRYDVARFYCDPREWQSEIEAWALKYGDERVVPWSTYRIAPMHAALERAVVDLSTGALTHDGDKQTDLHVGNAVMVAKPQGRYILGKPSPDQKIDLTMTVVLAHEAASDARADGWGTEVAVDTRVFVLR